MEEFAHRKNIDRFERELAGERDPQRRKVLEDLLASERRRISDLLGDDRASRP
jgi:hypothetical protein